MDSRAQGLTARADDCLEGVSPAAIGERGGNARAVRTTHIMTHDTLIMMSKRLQVLLDEPELREIRRAARSQRITVAEWVRQALRAARRHESSADVDQKLAAIRAAARHEHPAGDIDQMNAEIERGYLGDSRS